MATFDVDSNMANSVESQTAGTGPVDSGVYEAEILKSFIYKADSGASMWRTEYKLNERDEPFIFFTALTNRKGEKTYIDKSTGQARLLPGIQALIRFERIVNKTDEIKGADGKAKVKDNTVDALILDDVIGKKVLLGIKQEENFYNGNMTIRNFVSHILNIDGTNEDGENIAEKVSAAIARNPIKKLKATTPGGPVAAPQAQKAPKGW